MLKTKKKLRQKKISGTISGKNKKDEFVRIIVIRNRLLKFAEEVKEVKVRNEE